MKKDNKLFEIAFFNLIIMIVMARQQYQSDILIVKDKTNPHPLPIILSIDLKKSRSAM